MAGDAGQSKKWADLTQDERFDYLMNNINQRDCSFLVGTSEKSAKLCKYHKWILCELSPVFGRTFLDGPSDGPVVLDKIEPEIFNEILLLCFAPNKTIKLATAQIIELYRSVDEFDVEIMKQACLRNLSATLISVGERATLQDIVEIWQFWKSLGKDTNDAPWSVVWQKLNHRGNDLLECTKLYHLSPLEFSDFLISLFSYFNANRSGKIEMYIFDLFYEYLRRHDIQYVGVYSELFDASDVDSISAEERNHLHSFFKQYHSKVQPHVIITWDKIFHLAPIHFCELLSTISRHIRQIAVFLLFDKYLKYRNISNILVEPCPSDGLSFKEWRAMSKFFQDFKVFNQGHQVPNLLLSASEKLRVYETILSWETE